MHFSEQMGYVMELQDFFLPLATASLGVDLAGSELCWAAVAARAPQLPSKLGGAGWVAEWPGGDASPERSATAGWQPQGGIGTFGTASAPTGLLVVA